MSLFSELKRRNVIRMAVLYVVGSWLVLQVAELLTEILSVPEWTLRFVLMIILLGFPLTLLVSWVYEITPDGIKKESEIADGESTKAHTAKKLDVVVIGLLIAVLAVLAANRWLVATPEATPKADQSTTDSNAGAPAVAANIDSKSLAILPFVNLSGDDSNEYFSDGLTETLLHVLAGIPELKVAARTSSFAFKDRNEDIRDIARTLGVAHVLEGSVQRSGDQVRITAQLIRAADGFHIWSENFDKTLDDIFEIQDDIANEVSKALRVSLLRSNGGTGLAGVSTTSVAAYDLYLQARAEYSKASVASLATAEKLLNRALITEPNFVEAISALGSVYMWQVETGVLGKTVGFERVIDLTERALSLDPDNVEAAVLEIEAKGLQAYVSGDTAFSAENEKRLRALTERAIGEVEPKVAYAALLAWQQNIVGAIAQLQRAIELDPLNPEWHYRLGTTLASARRLDAARLSFKRSLELEPAQPNVYSALANLAQGRGDFVAMIHHLDRAIALDPDDPEIPGALAMLLYKADLPDYANDYAVQSIAMDGDSPYTRWVALVRSRYVDSPESTHALAQQMIASDIENRRGAFVATVGIYLETAIQLDALDDSLAFIRSKYPDFDTLSYGRVAPQIVESRILASFYLFDSLSPAQKMTEASLQRGYFASIGYPIETVQSMNVLVLALEQNYTELKRFMLDTVFPSYSYRLPHSDERRLLDSSLLAPIANDPEIMAGTAAWDAAFARSRDELVEVLNQSRAEQKAVPTP